MPPLLEVENLEVRAAETGQPLLRGTSFRVEPGECVAVLGPSGAGKTTLFRAINGTVPVSGGVLRFAGEDVTGCTGAAPAPAHRGDRAEARPRRGAARPSERHRRGARCVECRPRHTLPGLAD